MSVVVDDDAFVRSDFQVYASKKIIAHLRRHDEMKIYACYEFPMTDKKYGWKGGKPRSQDLHIEIYSPVRASICFEMKLTSHDIASGYGMNFVETFNFLCYPENAGLFSKQKHCSNLEEYVVRRYVKDHVGILLFRENGEISCLRESTSKDGKKLIFGTRCEEYIKKNNKLKLIGFREGMMMDKI